MSGHNKWSQIKHQKGAGDAAKSKIFGKLSKAISMEVKKAGGSTTSPAVQVVIKKAKEYNMPNDTIERAIKKSVESAPMENITYEAYGPGGCALIIEALTENKNKAAQDIKHILSEHGSSLAGVGAASWAFKKEAEGWIPQTTVEISEEDGKKLEQMISDLEESEEVQEVFTNAQ